MSWLDLAWMAVGRVVLLLAAFLAALIIIAWVVMLLLTAYAKLRQRFCKHEWELLEPTQRGHSMTHERWVEYMGPKPWAGTVRICPKCGREEYYFYGWGLRD